MAADDFFQDFYYCVT